MRSSKQSLASLASSGTLVATSSSGASLTIAAGDRAHYALTANRRGVAKIVDASTGRTVLRGVTTITRK